MGAGYVFYYEGLDPSAKTTPFLTTIMRVYWYMLQITVILDDLRRDVSTKRTCTTMDGEVQLKATHVIFACALFLIDLYLYLPTSHRMKNIPMSESNTSDINLDIPAIYVWMMIYKMFLEGHVCFSKKVVTDGGTNHEEGAKEFWAFLQFLVGLIHAVLSLELSM
jgi:hypothetical protein